MTINQSTSVSTEFGYYPERIEIENERFSVKTLSNLENSIAFVTGHPNTHKDWIYAELQRTENILSGETTTLPYSSRTFKLPKTHVLTLHKSDNIEDIDFVVWCLSFFTGMRLTITEAGFLDATPVKKGKLVDFVLSQCTIEDAIELSLDYLESEHSNFRATKRVKAVIHSLFLAQYPQSLSFERFQYLYMSLDSCYKLIEEKSSPKPNRGLSHAARVQWMCEQFNICIPDWAITKKKSKNNGSKLYEASEISEVRNDTLHEALFFDEPLGFAIYSNNQPDGKQINVILEMQHLICRLLVCILRKSDADYVKSSINDRQRKGLRLRKQINNSKA